MPPAYINTSVTNTAKLLNFFAMTDIHISDKESPAQAIFFGYKGWLISGYSPIMLTQSDDDPNDPACDPCGTDRHNNQR